MELELLLNRYEKGQISRRELLGHFQQSRWLLLRPLPTHQQSERLSN